MKKTWMVAAMAAVALATASPAAADDSGYLGLLKGEQFYSRLGPQVLLQEGHKVCRMISAGSSESDIYPVVVQDLSVSYYAAGMIVGAAAAGLGC